MPAGALTRVVLTQLGLADVVLAGVVSEEESVRRVLSKVQLVTVDPPVPAMCIPPAVLFRTMLSVIKKEVNPLGSDTNRPPPRS